MAELTAILQEIRATPDINFVVEVTIPTTDVPAAIRSGLAADVGEDEIQNPDCRRSASSRAGGQPISPG